MKKVSNRTPLSRPTRKKLSVTPASIEELIEKAWPDGIVDMSFDEEESYFWKIYEKLKANISKVPDTGVIEERAASPDYSSIDDEDEDGLNEAWDEGSRSYHLFVVPLEPAINVPIDVEQGAEEDDAEEDVEEDYVEIESEFDEEEFDEPEVIGHSLGFLLAISLVAPVAIVIDYPIEETEYGTDCSPPLGLPCAFDSTGQVVEPDYRPDLNAQDRKRVDEIRKRIVRVLEMAGLKVLPFDQRQKIVPGLKATEEVFLSQPLRVQDAFFFEGP